MSTLVFRIMNWQIARAELPQYVLIGGWVLSMIALPIVLWTIGDDALAYGTTASVILLVSATSSIMAKAWGWRRALLAAITVALLGWAIEFVGSKTGFPFGSYSYTHALQPQAFGVPLLIPLAWLMMMPPAWAVAQCIVFGDTESAAFRPYRRALFILITALAFTAWDLFLDPQMVTWGFWVWHDPGTFNYFGIPIVNFMGWMLAAVLMTTVVNPPRFARAHLSLLLAVYGITIFLQTVGVGVFWEMPGAALCGCLAMSTCLLAARRGCLAKP
jgi:putative membrane protein